MTRRKSRIIAFQAVYSWDVGKISVDDLLKFEWVEEITPEDEPNLAFSRLLIAGTIENIDEIDAAIKSHLSPKWDFNRLNKVSLAILRISIFCLFHQRDTHSSIVIDEAVGIAKEYGADDSYKFINGLLDTVAKSLPEQK